MLNAGATGFTATDNTLGTARQNHLAILLPHNNQVLIVGGLGGRERGGVGGVLHAVGRDQRRVLRGGGVRERVCGSGGAGGGDGARVGGG